MLAVLCSFVIGFRGPAGIDEHLVGDGLINPAFRFPSLDAPLFPDPSMLAVFSTSAYFFVRPPDPVLDI